MSASKKASVKPGWGSKFTGKSFAFAGKIWNIDAYKELIISEDGKIVDEVKANLDYLVIGRARGATAQEKEAATIFGPFQVVQRVFSSFELTELAGPATALVVAERRSATYALAGGRAP